MVPFCTCRMVAALNLLACSRNLAAVSPEIVSRRNVMTVKNMGLPMYAPPTPKTDRTPYYFTKSWAEMISLPVVSLSVRASLT